jgi:hypothetical protein
VQHFRKFSYSSRTPLKPNAHEAAQHLLSTVLHNLHTFSLCSSKPVPVPVPVPVLTTYAGSVSFSLFPWHCANIIRTTCTSVTAIQGGPPGFFCTYFYNHAHRLCLENYILHIELPRSSNGYFKPLLDPGGGFTSETAARWFQN